jgi:hypothetical protein
VWASSQPRPSGPAPAARRHEAEALMIAPTISALHVLAEESTPGHEGVNPIVNGIITFAVFLVLLFITTRFNRER